MIHRLGRQLATHPATWLMVATLAALEWGFVSWFQPSAVMLAAAAALGLVLVAAWPVLLLRSPAFLKRLYDPAPDADANRLLELESLAADLEQVHSEQGLEQLRLLGEKMESLRAVLERRLDRGELTFGRYLATAEQVYLSAVDNLHDIAVALTSVRTIDPDYIESRMKDLERLSRPGDDARRELETLEQRRTLRDQQLRRVSELFAQNEQAMTALANTAAALADVRIARGRASIDAEAAMAELEELARRTGSYARDGSRQRRE
ncbi:MAG: hypothetical protein R3286_04300 [Gammaproteobacteria bacterium]|nr:hypothetical protein [Gammaproteobacteria bacterium]